MPDDNRTERPPASSAAAAALARDKSEVRNAPTADLTGLYNLLGVPDQLLEPVAQTIESYTGPLGVTESGNPDFYGPLSRAFGRATGLDEDTAARWAASRVSGTRNLMEGLIGPEEFIGGLNRIGTGDGGFWDYANTALVAAPGPIGKGIKRFAIDPLVSGYRRLFPAGLGARAGEALDDVYRAAEEFDPSEVSTEYLTRMTQRLYDAGATRDELEQFLAQYGRQFSDADELGRVVQARDTAAPAARVVRQAAERPSVNVGLVVEPDMYSTGRREQISPMAAQQALSDLGVNVERSQVRMSDTEPTLVAELNRALSPEEAFTVSRNLRQKAIAQVDPTAGGALHGPMAEEWGTFNPNFYLPFDQDATAFAVQRGADFTDPANAFTVGELEQARRQLFDRELISRNIRKGGLTDEQAAELMSQLPPEAGLRMRLAEMGADTIEMPAEWARSVAQPRRFEQGRAPTEAAGVHYSRVGGLTRTDPTFYGTGHKGSEYAGVRNDDLPNRTYFYAEGADGTPITPEEPVSRIAPFVYDADLRNLYDVNSDPEQLAALARAYAGLDPATGVAYQPVSPLWVRQGQGLESSSALPDLERLIRQYGYSGYISDYAPSWAPKSRRAAAMFEPVDVRPR